MPLAEVYNYNETSSRNYFVRRVFFLLTIMMAFTSMFVVMCLAVDDMKMFILKNRWFMFAGCIMFTATSLTMQCCPIGRIQPWNYICLILATISMSMMTAGISVHYKTYCILIALAITCILCFVLTLLACSSFDFTRFLLYAVVFGLVLSVFGVIFLLVTIFDHYIKTMHMIYACLTALFTSFMFVMELQMILGGRSVELDTDEYVVGALMLYTSLMQLFLTILQLTGMFDE